MLARRLMAASGGVASGLDPDAVTLIAAMTTAPDAARQQLISDHIIALKAAGIWSLLDIYYILAAHHEQASRLNWKSPGDFTLTANGTITFTTDRGWQGDGTGYLDTGWIPSVNGVNYTLNDASLGVYSRTNLIENTYNMGANNGSFSNMNNIVIRWNTGENGQSYNRVNQSAAGAIIVDTANSQGLFVARRTGAAEQQSFRNGAQVGSNATTSSNRATVSVFISAVNNNGTPLSPATHKKAAAFTGAAMSEAQHAALYDAQQNGYLAAVGAAV
jgi:hypothetical protein